MLPAVADTDARKCVRCQGEHRWLPEPHPVDHLCKVCRTECPGCGAPTGMPGAGLCRACRRVCRICQAQLPPPEPQTPPQPAQGPADGPGRPRERHRFTSPAWQLLCPSCRRPQGAEREVLSAYPPKLLRACGGHVPAKAVRVIQDELLYHLPRVLAARIERRWHTRWTHRKLSYDGDGEQWTAYGPDDIALWLVAPTSCPGRCEDGWVRDEPDRQCPVCRPPRAYRAREEPLSAHAQDMVATARGIIAAARQPRDPSPYVPPG